MWIPTVRPEDVEKFKQLVLERFGKELTDDEALDGANRLVQIYFWKTYGNKVLSRLIREKRHPEGRIWEEKKGHQTTSTSVS